MLKHYFLKIIPCVSYGRYRVIEQDTFNLSTNVTAVSSSKVSITASKTQEKLKTS